MSTARELDVRMGEVTASETNLLAMARLVDVSGLPVELVATRAHEGTAGADFEIWLAGGNRRFFGCSIQAKIVAVERERFA